MKGGSAPAARRVASDGERGPGARDAPGARRVRALAGHRLEDGVHHLAELAPVAELHREAVLETLHERRVGRSGLGIATGQWLLLRRAIRGAAARAGRRLDSATGGQSGRLLANRARRLALGALVGARRGGRLLRCIALLRLIRHVSFDLRTNVTRYFYTICTRINNRCNLKCTAYI